MHGGQNGLGCICPRARKCAEAKISSAGGAQMFWEMSRNENGWSEMSASYICLGGWVTPLRQANDDVTVIENTLATRNGE